jgi:hypothetical protein
MQHCWLKVLDLVELCTRGKYPLTSVDTLRGVDTPCNPNGSSSWSLTTTGTQSKSRHEMGVSPANQKKGEARSERRGPYTSGRLQKRNSYPLARRIFYVKARDRMPSTTSIDSNYLPIRTGARMTSKRRPGCITCIRVVNPETDWEDMKVPEENHKSSRDSKVNLRQLLIKLGGEGNGAVLTNMTSKRKHRDWKTLRKRELIGGGSTS